MEQIKFINLENVSDEEANKFRFREAARAIVLDENKCIGLIHATKNHYYKLPGGGIESGETKEFALERECKEEIGCKIKILAEVGSVLEYRKQFNLKQVSYCYIAQLVGEKGFPKLEQDEIEEGFETVWLPLKDALAKVKGSEIFVYEAQYMVTRDTALLEMAGELLKKSI